MSFPPSLPGSAGDAGDVHHTLELKGVTLEVTVPQPLADTLTRMAEWRNVTVEGLIIRLLAESSTLQKYYTRESLALWVQSR